MLTKPKSNLPNRLIWSFYREWIQSLFSDQRRGFRRTKQTLKRDLVRRHFALELILLDQDLSVNYCLNYVNAKYLHANKVTCTKNEKYIKCPDIF